MRPFAKEILRKLIHIAELILIFGYTYIRLRFSERIGVLALTGLLMFFLELEYIRIDYRPEITKRFARLVEKLVLRKHEKDRLVGAIYIIAATIITFSSFDYPIALTALLMMVFGDMFSALFGMAFGGPKIFRNKTWIGAFFGLFSNLIIGYFLFPQFPLLYIGMAVTASVVEALTQKIDDNLTVPLFSGAVGQAIVFFFGIHLPAIFGLQ